MTDGGVYHVHVMKTGGTSLSKMLRALYGPDRSYPNQSMNWVATFAPKALLELAECDRSRLQFISTHMGAWVAEEEFPHHLTVTVLRDPVARTISHLRQIASLRHTPQDLDEIYDDPIWNSRLVNHQCQVFASSRGDYVERAQEARQPGNDSAGAGSLDFRSAMRAAVATTIGAPSVIDDTSFARATARLDRIDEVGVTERLGDLVKRLSRRLDWTAPPLRHDRASAVLVPVPVRLRDRIDEENQWDRLLYERALARQT